MRSMCLTTLTLTISMAAAAVTPSQGTRPTRPAGPEPECYMLKPVEIPGENHRWARVRTGDEWITGCIGPAGMCFTAVWVPC